MGGDSTTEKYDVVLVATGRRPYTEGLGLENLGIQTDRLGRIQVDSHQFMPLEIASIMRSDCQPTTGPPSFSRFAGRSDSLAP